VGRQSRKDYDFLIRVYRFSIYGPNFKVITPHALLRVNLFLLGPQMKADGHRWLKFSTDSAHGTS